MVDKGAMMDQQQKRLRIPEWLTEQLIWWGPMLLLWLVPTLLGFRFHIASFLFFIVFPGLIVTRGIFLVRSHRKLSSKLLRIGLLLILLALLFLIAMDSFFEIFRKETYRKTQVRAVETFEAELSGFSIPGMTDGRLELGAPKETELYSYDRNMFIFTSKARVLLCSYDTASYEAEKTALETRYCFRTELLQPSIGASEKEITGLESRAEIGNDVFRFLIPNDETPGISEYYFKACVMLVTNDEARQIGYIVFRDTDLDEAYDLEDFLNRYCGWSLIRT